MEGVEWRMEREREEATSEKVAGANPGGHGSPREESGFMSK